MTRDEAIKHAQKHAKALPESYYAEPFMPHEWVISAIMSAPYAEVREEVLRELLEWEAEYMQQARGGDRSGKSDARADATREIHDHLRSSWETRDKMGEA